MVRPWWVILHNFKQSNVEIQIVKNHTENFDMFLNSNRKFSTSLTNIQHLLNSSVILVVRYFVFCGEFRKTTYHILKVVFKLLNQITFIGKFKSYSEELLSIYIVEQTVAVACQSTVNWSHFIQEWFIFIFNISLLAMKLWQTLLHKRSYKFYYYGCWTCHHDVMLAQN